MDKKVGKVGEGGFKIDSWIISYVFKGKQRAQIQK